MKKINESFVCLNCDEKVPKASKTCRNHCPFCFMSRHVDKWQPGDRKADCNSLMVPINYRTSWDKVKILFKCIECWKKHWNKTADDDNLKVLDKMIEKYSKNYNC